MVDVLGVKFRADLVEADLEIIHRLVQALAADLIDAAEGELRKKTSAQLFRAIGESSRRHTRNPAQRVIRMREAEQHGARQIRIQQKQFRHLLSQTQYSMATQDVRYYLNGLLLLLDGEEIRTVATDGHRLAYSSMALSEAPEGLDQERLRCKDWS